MTPCISNKGLARPVLATLSIIAAASTANACDLCSTPTAPDGGRGFSVSVFEQYSHFGTLRDNGEEVSNDVDQYMDSSVTQVVIGYRFAERYSMQLVVPYIHRSFRRPEGFEIDQGTEQGMGDISLLASIRMISISGDDSVLRVDDLIGLKLPTGKSGRLGEEANEVTVPGAPDSGVHGHDLAEGSGSWDIPLAVDAFGRFERAYLGAHAQYTIRNRGTHQYQYANDFSWNVTPGFDVWRAATGRVGLEANLSGEAKGKDVSDNEVAGDTGIVAVYLGPQVSMAWNRHLLGVIGYDVPLLQNNTALQLVPDYRLHGGLTWVF